ncbi:MAG TPA: hypothetical protein VML55_12705 [Planctomycetaceae bacterium]|nr:hypothetical protein [Planctomycetaceae bacterium]
MLTPETTLADLPDLECRRHERLAHEVELCVWYRQGGRLVCVQAWSQDVSEGGLRFRCDRELPERLVFISTSPDAVPSEFAEICLVRIRQAADGWWEYGAEVKDVL